MSGVDLFHRIADAFLAGNASLEEREPLIAAAQGAQSFAALPADMRRLLRRIEARAQRLADQTSSRARRGDRPRNGVIE